MLLLLMLMTIGGMLLGVSGLLLLLLFVISDCCCYCPYFPTRGGGGGDAGVGGYELIIVYGIQYLCSTLIQLAVLANDWYLSTVLSTILSTVLITILSTSTVSGFTNLSPSSCRPSKQPRPARSKRV